MTLQVSEIPTQFTHDVKLEETAKGIRIHVHVYANSEITAAQQAFSLYRLCHKKAEELNIAIAPMEVVSK